MTIDLLHAIGISVGSLSVGVGIGFIFGCLHFDSWWQERAIKHGKAEYYLDENHKRKWRWKS